MRNTVKKPWLRPVNPHRPADERDWNLSDHATYNEFLTDLNAEIRVVHEKLMNWLRYKQEIEFRYGPTIRSRVQ